MNVEKLLAVPSGPSDEDLRVTTLGGNLGHLISWGLSAGRGPND